MENLFKNGSMLNWLMILLAFITMVVFLSEGSWEAAIWAFNTAVWCGIDAMDKNTINDLRDKISELLEEKYRKSKEENR